MSSNKILAGVLALSLSASVAVAANSTAFNAPLTAVLQQYRPGNTGFGKIRVDNVVIDNAKKTVTVQCNENTAYLHLTSQNFPALKADLLKALGDKYANYKLSVEVLEYGKGGKVEKRTDMKDLVLFSNKKVVAPTEKTPFVKRVDGVSAPKGMDGKNIAVWQSHGWYFEPKLNRWEWQRARIFQTVEDLYTQSYVMPYLMPMLQNAGAYVMSPRERDINRNEVVVDNDAAGYAEKGAWSKAEKPGYAATTATLSNGQNPFREGTARVAKTARKRGQAPVAQWSADMPAAGKYAVYVSYPSLENSAPDARYVVNSKAGATEFKVNQKMGGGTWIYLGHFDFDKGAQDKPVVELLGVSDHSGTVVGADAVKIGGGMGHVARIVKEPLDSIDYKYVTSHYPRYVEGARYWLQYAGAPDSVYTPSNNVNDYTDDYRSRGLWVNWLAGGSSVIPQRDGLKIPVDLSFAFHTDAGTTRNDSIIGTLGIYSTATNDNSGKYANGTDRSASRDLTDLIMTNIVNDVRAKYEPNWTRRGMWDKSYYEARVPEVPAMLLELLSHQNFADMKYGLDPNFRFDVSRAIYKGMLQFLANRDGREYVVTPLAPRNFAITRSGAESYTLSWEATPDSLEATAVPKQYAIQVREADGAFKPLATTADTHYTVSVPADGVIRSYRITALNDGGASFPGEVLALCNVPNAKGDVTVVNGFTRVSAPDWFEAGKIAGFYDRRDGGVADQYNAAYIGPMFEFRREIPWMDDDAAGFGASQSNYEDKVLAGNTFDFVYTHGQAIKDAGYSFVSSSVAAFSNAQDKPAIVDLQLGKQKEVKQGRGVYGTHYKTFPSELQNRIKALTEQGTNVFVSGAFVATDLWDNPNSSPEVAKADQKFATDVLGYHWRVGQASVDGQAYQVDTRYKAFTGGEYTFQQQPNTDCYAVESPDSFYGADPKKSATFMRYTENNLIAGTAYAPGNYRTVVLGFPFETIKSEKARASLMKQVLDFFQNK